MKNKVISLFCFGILACGFFYNRNFAMANNEMQLNDSIVQVNNGVVLIKDSILQIGDSIRFKIDGSISPISNYSRNGKKGNNTQIPQRQVSIDQIDPAKILRVDSLSNSY